MNRTLLFGIAMFFAIVAFALMGPERTAVAGHGGCNGKGAHARCGGKGHRCDGKGGRHRHARRCCGCNGGKVYKGDGGAVEAPEADEDAPAPPPAAPAPPAAEEA